MFDPVELPTVRPDLAAGLSNVQARHRRGVKGAVKKLTFLEDMSAKAFSSPTLGLDGHMSKNVIFFLNMYT